jgi:DNA polymerase I
MKVTRTLVRTPAEWNRAVEGMLASADQTVAADSEYEDRGWPNIATTGLSFAWKERKGRYHSIYVPVNHYECDDNGVWSRIVAQMALAQLTKGIQRLIDAGLRIVMHNAPADLKTFHGMGVTTDGIHLFDTMIASWLLETDRDCGHGLKGLTRHLYDFQMSELTEFCPWEMAEDRSKPVLKSGKNKGRYRQKKTGVLLTSRAPLPRMFDYATDDAYYTLKLSYTFAPLLEAEGLSKVFFNLEMEVQQYITEMEEHGMVINRPWLEEFSQKLVTEVAEWQQKVFNLRPGENKGVAFNTNSGKQLNEVFFDELGIEPRGNVGKNGFYSLGADILKMYANVDGIEIAKILGEVNKRLKMISTINSWLTRAVRHKDGTWRLHGNFNLHGTRTGRLSSSEPNLQNIPVRDKRFPLRRAFLAPPGMVVGDADYAQIELKILAHFSRDKRMLRIMTQGGDLHSETAKIAYHLDVPSGMSLKEEGKYIKKFFDTQRGRAKNVNFSIVYGVGERTLSVRYDVPLEEARELLANHPKIFPGAHKWLQQMRMDAARDGYVFTILGRKRHLPDAMLDPRRFPFGSAAGKNAFIKKGAAERRATNSPVQGSAADIIALAMRNIRRYFKKTGEWLVTVVPAAQVHDELVFYIKKSEAERVMSVISQIMNSALKLCVPTEADGSFGGNWIMAKCEHRFEDKEGNVLAVCPMCETPNPAVRQIRTVSRSKLRKKVAA